jgi:hypothetical protein
MNIYKYFFFNFFFHYNHFDYKAYYADILLFISYVKNYL